MCLYLISYIYFGMTPNLLTKQMESVCIVSGELDSDFVGEATFYDHGGVNQSSGEDSVGKQPEKRQYSAISAKKVPTHIYSDDELGNKKEVNSTGSRLYVPRLSNHLSLPRI